MLEFDIAHTRLEVQDDTQTTIRRTTTDDRETEIGVPGSDQRDNDSTFEDGFRIHHRRRRGRGTRRCARTGGSGSEPTRLEFTGIQTGGYTRRCTNSGSRAETARIIRSQQGPQRRIDGINIASVGAQGGAQALAVCQDRSGSEPTGLKVREVHKAVHQLWLSARIVRRSRIEWADQRPDRGIIMSMTM
jgi:hypothetical protein